MSAWKIALGTLCGVGILKEINVLRGFDDHFLTSGLYNLTNDELQFEIHPVFAYTYVCALLVVLLVADFLSYKPVVVVGIFALFASTALITWGEGLLIAQMSEFTAGLGSATDLAYFAYGFAVVETEHFLKAASLPRAALLFGRLIGYGVGEIAVFAFDADYAVLKYATLGLLGVAFLISMLLPSAVLSAFQRVIERELQSPDHGRFHSQASIQGSNVSIQDNPGQTTPVKRADDSSMPRYIDALSTGPEAGHTSPSGPMFYDIDTSSLGFSYNDMTAESSDMSSLDRTSIEISQQSQVTTHLKEQESLNEKITLSISTVKETYTKRSVIVWTIFWIVIATTNSLMATSITPLLTAKYPQRNQVVADGILEPVSLFAGAVLVFVISFVKVTWANVETLFLGVTSLVFCLLIGLMSAVDSVWLTYCLYVVCRVLYQLSTTVAMYRVAMFVNARRFAMVFGVGMMGSAILVVIFTGAVVADKNVGFSIVAQFAVYSGMLGVCGLCLLGTSLYVCISHKFFKKTFDNRDDLDTLIHS